MAATAARCLLMVAVVSTLLVAGAAGVQLSSRFYDRRCPKLQSIVRSVMVQAVATEPRMGASILRLFFHDCFVNGCDASILLDDTGSFTGEKNAGPNANSVRGYDVIDTIKTQVEAACRATVSCADIVALAARDGVNLVTSYYGSFHDQPCSLNEYVDKRTYEYSDILYTTQLGGPTWAVPLGRRDALNASQSAANSNLPAPGSSLDTLITMFGNKGLSSRDMTALSGAHTIGQARCTTFRERIYNDTNVNATFAALRQQTCGPQSGGGDDGTLAPIDVSTPDRFDNAYYENLASKQGLFHSDQELYNGGSQDALVRRYRRSAGLFAADFAKAMVRMGSLMPSADTPTEVRLDCKKIN